MQFLHTVLYTFPEVWQGEFVLQSIASLVGDHFLFFVTLKCDLGATTCIYKEKLDATHSLGLTEVWLLIVNYTITVKLAYMLKSTI